MSFISSCARRVYDAFGCGRPDPRLDALKREFPEVQGLLSGYSRVKLDDDDISLLREKISIENRYLKKLGPRQYAEMRSRLKEHVFVWDQPRLKKNLDLRLQQARERRLQAKAEISQRNAQFSSMRNARSSELVRDFPRIDVSKFLRSCAEMDLLDDAAMGQIREWLFQESAICDELGSDYFSVLRETGKNFFLEFNADPIGLQNWVDRNLARFEFVDLANKQRLKRDSGLWKEFKTTGPLLERAVLARRLIHGLTLWLEIDVYANEWQRDLILKFSPRFTDRHFPLTNEDRELIQQFVKVCNENEERFQRPQDRVVLEQYFLKFKLLDFYVAKRAVAEQNRDREGFDAVNGAIRELQDKIFQGPVFSVQIEEPRIDRTIDLKDNYITFPFGDILSDKPGKGRRIVIDWFEIPPEERAELFNRIDNPEMLNQWLADKQPYEHIAFNYANGDLTAVDNSETGKKILQGGALRIFYQPGNEVIEGHRSLELGYRPRIVRKTNDTWSDRIKNYTTEAWARDLVVGEYARVAKPPKNLSAMEQTPNQERTAILERQHVIDTIAQLAERIRKDGRIDPNTALRLKEYMASVAGSDLLDEDDRYRNAMQLYGQIGGALDRLFGSEEGQLTDLIAKSDSGVDKNKYDLAEGVKNIKEIPRMFSDWVKNIDELLKEVDKDQNLKSDFSWFAEELMTIRSNLEYFANSFPRESSDASQESFIDAALNCIQDSPILRALPHALYRLGVAQEGATFNKYKRALLEKHTKNRLFVEKANLVLPNAFQALSRVALCLEPLIKNISRPSPLLLKTLKTYTLAKKTALELESRREIEMQHILGRCRDKSRMKEIILNFYPGANL